MSEPFIPVPPGALAVVGREGRLAVLDLYERAFAARWAPLPFTERELGEAWGCGRKVAMRILEGLSGAGFVEVRPGAGRRPSAIVVRNPTGHGTKSGPETGPNPPRKEADNPSRRNQSRDQIGTTHARVVDAEEEEEEEIDPSPQPPAQAGGLSEPARVVAERALVDLEKATALGRSVDELVAQYATADQAVVRRAYRTFRGSTRVGIDGVRRREPPAGVPHGLRERDVAEGLREAARRWAARPRPPPGEEDP
jgi:hypothetical protein